MVISWTRRKLAGAAALGLASAAEALARPRKLPVVLISANAEWKVVKEILRPAKVSMSPHGEWFSTREAVFVHGGWGKVAAAASTEYAITRWDPELVVNLGTCGGVAGAVERYAVVLVSKTIIYDIVEQMGDSAEAIRDYSTDIDLGWLPGAAVSKMPDGMIRGVTMLSADRDLVAGELPGLQQKYGMRVGDWESGAIAWVAVRKHRRRLVILRGVTDLVTPNGRGQAYGKPEEFAAGTRVVMEKLLGSLNGWLGLV